MKKNTRRNAASRTKFAANERQWHNNLSDWEISSQVVTGNGRYTH